MTLHDINLILRPLMAIICLGVGFGAMGVDVLKTCSLNQLQKPFKLIAGLAGALALIEWAMSLS